MRIDEDEQQMDASDRKASWMERGPIRIQAFTPAQTQFLAERRRLAMQVDQSERIGGSGYRAHSMADPYKP